MKRSLDGVVIGDSPTSTWWRGRLLPSASIGENWIDLPVGRYEALLPPSAVTI